MFGKTIDKGHHVWYNVTSPATEKEKYMRDILIRWINEADDAAVTTLFYLVKGFLHK